MFLAWAATQAFFDVDEEWWTGEGARRAIVP